MNKTAIHTWLKAAHRFADADAHCKVCIIKLYSVLFSMSLVVFMCFDCYRAILQALKLGGTIDLPVASPAPRPPVASPAPRPIGRRQIMPIAHRVKNATPFGRWSIWRIYDRSTGVERLVGIGANCHEHNDPARPTLPCNRIVTITATCNEDRARWLCKLWLLAGCKCSLQERRDHVHGVNAHELDVDELGETEADLDAEAARR